MGERSLKACIEERLQFCRDHLRGADMTVQDFYDTGCDFEAVADKLDDVARESLANAWGYLEGVADALDTTVLEAVESHDLAMDTPLTPDRRATVPLKKKRGSR